MSKDTLLVIGVMSGTSLDGVDLVLCEMTSTSGRWDYRLLDATTEPYSAAWLDRLRHAYKLSASNLLVLHQNYGRFLGELCRDFAGDRLPNVDLVASHGHTIFHQIDRGLTYQAGDGQYIANVTGTITASDFRSMDVSIGGQGAPLVPIGDQVFFSAYDACLNLGGIANISFEQGGDRIAYDIGPCNMLLNHVVGELGLPYDDRGTRARTGQIIKEMFDAFNELNYFLKRPPKSLGVEWFHEEVMPLLGEYSASSTEDRLHTAVHHVAFQIGRALGDFGKVLVTGGGAKNDFLTELINQYSGHEVTVPEAELVDFKEAIVFALIGVLRLKGEVNTLKSVTGARADTCGGVLYYPNGKI